MAEWTLCLLCHHYVYLYIKGCINRDFGLIIWNRFGVALLLYCSMARIPNNDLSATSEGTFFFLIKSDKTLLEIRQKSELDFVSVKYLKKKMDSWAQNITRFIALNAIGKFRIFNGNLFLSFHGEGDQNPLSGTSKNYDRIF